MSNTKSIDDALINFLEATDDKTIKSLLSESIENIDEYEQKKLKLQKEITFMIKAQEKYQKHELLLMVAKQFEEALLKNTEKPIAMLKQLIGSNQAFALNKGLETLTREEIVEIIKDKNLIELLDKLNDE